MSFFRPVIVLPDILPQNTLSHTSTLLSVVGTTLSANFYLGKSVGCTVRDCHHFHAKPTANLLWSFRDSLNTHTSIPYVIFDWHSISYIFFITLGWPIFIFYSLTYFSFDQCFLLLLLLIPVTCVFQCNSYIINFIHYLNTPQIILQLSNAFNFHPSLNTIILGMLRLHFKFQFLQYVSTSSDCLYKS